MQHIDTFLKKEFNYLEVTFDKSAGGCSKRRPDIAIDCFTHVLINEVDEFGHDTEEYCSCENKRMMQIFEDYGNRPIVFIRMNPDSYVNSKGTKIPSCFSKSKKTGLLQILKPKMWEERLQVIEERIRHHIENIPDREITIEHLYYNGFH